MVTTTQFTIAQENRPGKLVKMAEALGETGINIDGIHGMPCAGQSVFQFVTNNPGGATQALDAAGVQYTTREVLVLSPPNEPGCLARIAHGMASAGVNINAIYATRGHPVILDVDDLARGQEVASELGIL